MQLDQVAFDKWCARARSGLQKLFGFGLSMVLLGAASLASIPAMIAASGPAAWGAIALGQSVGSVAAIAVLYGWTWFGPAKIARVSPRERRSEYLESVVARLVLMIPACAGAAATAFVLSPNTPSLAAIAAISVTGLGLSAQWYFVGAARPYHFLVLDTIPRVGALALGIFLMHIGHSASTGPISVLVGTIAAFTASTVWILSDTRKDNANTRQLRGPLEILVLHRHGMMAAVSGSAYDAAPQAIVSVVAPSIQPLFALTYKIFRQIFTASIPVLDVLQGWVLRGSEASRVRRANLSLVVAATLAIVLGGVTAALGQKLIAWLGNGLTPLPESGVLLISGCVSIAFFESTISRTVLAAFDLLHVVKNAILVGAPVGLSMVWFGARMGSLTLAQSGLLLGLVTISLVELLYYFLFLRNLDLYGAESRLVKAGKRRRFGLVCWYSR